MVFTENHFIFTQTDNYQNNKVHRGIPHHVPGVATFYVENAWEVKVERDQELTAYEVRRAPAVMTLMTNQAQHAEPELVGL